ncbi:hypothetical protein CEXT_782441 [Caerostris extrusa]|uniref:Uncharacterized protein n=1 Tax=Caerostris extrusa TaxID=172846 RepID=A0AAV4MG32_CAEEX|nr:hypothetical protein CEXT_782441 [Caerostris extrusa]
MLINYLHCERHSRKFERAKIHHLRNSSCRSAINNRLQLKIMQSTPLLQRAAFKPHIPDHPFAGQLTIPSGNLATNPSPEDG